MSIQFHPEPSWVETLSHGAVSWSAMRDCGIS